MTTWDDVVRLAAELPEVEASTWYGSPALKVAGKGFVRHRTEAEGGVVLFCGHDEKAALLASDDPAFFTTPHYDGYPTILVDLARIDLDQLAEVIEESWYQKAPKKLIRSYDEDRGD